ncbi:MAG: histidine kinase, partial [Bacteroidales bacterium]|nr:histidine kinase [Bacteroidales bacterium]
FKGMVVYNLYKDLHGYIWIATEAGLYKYNGQKIHHYDKKKGLPSNIVFGVHNVIFTDTFLFVRTFSPDIAIYNYKTDSFYVVKPFHSKAKFTELDEFFISIIDTPDTLFLQSARKAMIILKKNLFFKRTYPFVNNKTTFSFGNVGNTSTIILHHAIVPKDTTFYIKLLPFYFETKQAKYLIYTNVLLVYDKHGKLIGKKYFKSSVSDVKMLDSNKLIISTLNRGVFVYEISTNSIWSILNNNIICHSLYIINDKLFCSTSEGIYAIPLISLTKDKKTSYLGKNKTSYTILYEDSQLLIKKYYLDEKIFIYNKNKNRFVFKINFVVKDFTSDSSFLYIAGHKIIYIFSLSNNKFVDTIMVYERIQSFEKLTENLFILGNQNGIYVLNKENNQLDKFTYCEFCNSNIFKIKKHKDKLIIATYSEGIYFVDYKNFPPSIWYHFSDLTQQNIRTIKFYENNILVLTNSSFILFKTDPHKIDKINVLKIPLDDSLKNENIYDLWLSGDDLYVEGENKIKKINFLSNDTNNNEYAFSILSIKIDDHFIHDRYVEINQNKKLMIRFKHLNFKNDAIEKIGYKIIKNQEILKESYLTNTTFDTIFNEPGNYVLKFFTPHSKREEILQVYVLPKWYETLFFKISVIILTFTFLVFLILSLLKVQKNLMKKKLIFIDYQIKSLYNQLQPHFLSNALNSLLGLIKLKQLQEAEQYLLLISKYFREVINANKQSLVTLEAEIDLIEKYLKIEKKRLQNKLKYEIIVDPDIDLIFVKIPSMCIHPFIENAIKHGLNEENKSVSINIIFRILNDELICLVNNNGKWKENKNISSDSIGLELVKQRLYLFNRSFFTVTKGEKEVSVEIHFKLE